MKLFTKVNKIKVIFNILHEREFFFLSVIFFFLSVIFFAKRGTSVKSHATHAARARNKRGSSVDFARILRGFCVGFARNLILFLFEREREGYKRFLDCTVGWCFYRTCL